MQRLRFICENAKLNEAKVAAVNGDTALVYNEIYTVSNELADELLKNDGDWRLLSPPDAKSKAAEEKEAVAADEVGDVPSVLAEGEDNP